MTVYFHGELTVFSGASIPKSAKKLNPTKGRYILAESEQSGNHHILVAEDGVDVYEQNGVLYCHVEEEARIECVLRERHDTQVLPAGDYEIGRAFEFDHLQKTRRVVAD